LIEVETAAATTSTEIKYRLRASGLARDVVFGVWAKDFGHAYHEVASGFRLDESGAIVSNEVDGDRRPRRLDELVLTPGPYPRGAAWEVALASLDGHLRTFAKVIPRPLTGRDGTCSISLELASRRGDRFVVSGAGFVPGEDISTELRYSGQTSRKTARVSAEGHLMPDVLFLGGTSPDHGARFLVKGRSCEVAVDYQWGEPALEPR